MTLVEYKRQAQEIAEILMNFSGKEEEAEKFTKNLLGKYREFGEINAKALECKDLAEFKNLANGNGMEFESDEEANELFLGLSKGKKEVEKAILSAEEMSTVSGGLTRTSKWIGLGAFLTAIFVGGHALIKSPQDISEPYFYEFLAIEGAVGALLGYFASKIHNNICELIEISRNET